MLEKSLKIIASILPGFMMLSAHWAPWHKTLGRKLHRLEAYTIGMGSVVGVSVALLEIAEQERPNMRPRNAAQIVMLSAISAGVSTFCSWAIDWALETKHQLMDEEERNARWRER